MRDSVCIVGFGRLPVLLEPGIALVRRGESNQSGFDGEARLKCCYWRHLVERYAYFFYVKNTPFIIKTPGHYY